MVTLHTSMPYCQYLCMRTAISSGQEKWHEKLRNKCEIGFCDQLILTWFTNTILATKYRGKYVLSGVQIKVVQEKEYLIGNNQQVSEMERYLTLRNEVNRKQ